MLRVEIGFAACLTLAQQYCTHELLNTYRKDLIDQYLSSFMLCVLSTLQAVRLTVVTDTSNLSPLLVSVQQNLGVSSFELPRTHNG